jgi:DNA-binding FadR family transcriptional regulator
MSFELRVVGRSKLSDAIMDQILEGIRSGAFGPGTVLPPERSLAERFGVSRGAPGSHSLRSSGDTAAAS